VPLSLIYLDVVASRGVERRLVKVLRPALRGADVIGDLGNGRLLVILPETGDELARGLASELTAVLHRAGLGHVVGPTHVVTADAGLDAEQLIAQVNNQRGDDQPTGYRAAGKLA
jgi:GGDEF domain-containing protein